MKSQTSRQSRWAREGKREIMQDQLCSVLTLQKGGSQIAHNSTLTSTLFSPTSTWTGYSPACTSLHLLLECYEYRDSKFMLKKTVHKNIRFRNLEQQRFNEWNKIRIIISPSTGTPSGLVFPSLFHRQKTTTSYINCKSYLSGSKIQTNAFKFHQSQRCGKKIQPHPAAALACFVKEMKKKTGVWKLINVEQVWQKRTLASSKRHNLLKRGLPSIKLGLLPCVAVDYVIFERRFTPLELILGYSYTSLY